MNVALRPRASGSFGVVLENQLVFFICQIRLAGADVSLDFVLEIGIPARRVLLDSFFVLLDRFVRGVHAEIEITGLKICVRKLLEIGLHLTQQRYELGAFVGAEIKLGECEA